MVTRPRIPLTVLGGFLGSGKTTLLNHLLNTSSGLRIAVLVNDFGPINVDASLLARNDGDTISLSNGCICCSIGSGLDAALIRVLDRDPLPDWIVIEASGVSDPSRIAQVGVSDPLLQLEATVVMIDAEQIIALADDPLLTDTIERQMGSADVLVLNKTDLVSADQLSDLKSELTLRYGQIPTIEAQHGKVSMDVLMGSPLLTRVDAPHARHHGAEPEHPFESGRWTGKGVMSADALIQALKQLPRSVIRLKGWVITDRHGPTVVHLAGRRVRFQAVSDASAIKENELVYIGLRGEPLHDAVCKQLNPLLGETP